MGCFDHSFVPLKVPRAEGSGGAFVHRGKGTLFNLLVREYVGLSHTSVSPFEFPELTRDTEKSRSIGTIDS